VWSQYEEAGHGPLLLKGLVVRRDAALSLMTWETNPL
jgi:hypothetical protein